MVAQTSELGAESIFAKFVFRLSELRPDGRIKSKNLVPRADEALSVTNIDNLEVREICSHGRQYIDNRELDRIHIGFCQYPVSCLAEIGISPIFDNSPPLHVSLRFPEDLAKKKEMALLLERRAIKCNDTARPYLQRCNLVQSDDM